MKRGVIALGVVGALSFSGFTQANSLSQSDMEFLFGSQSVQAKTISIQEMKDTNGEFWPIFYWGAVGVVRSIMWIAPRIAPRYFRYIDSWNRTKHRILLGGRSSRHLLQIGIDKRKGHHIGIGWDSRNRARWHIYRKVPWKINPY